MNSKHSRENQCTCDILMFIYLMVSKLLYLHMDMEIYNSYMTEVPIM